MSSGGTAIGGNEIRFFPNSSNTSYGNNYITFTNAGEVSAVSFNATSDIRHKENIHELENALEKIASIRGVKFNFKDNDKIHAGIIAQEVAPIMPELINKDNDDKWSANYDGLIPYLIESVKTLSKDNKELKDKIKTLETKIDLIMQQLNP